MTEIEKELEQAECDKKRRAALIKAEFAGLLSSEDEDIIDEWAFEFPL